MKNLISFFLVALMVVLPSHRSEAGFWSSVKETLRERYEDKREARGGPRTVIGDFLAQKFLGASKYVAKDQSARGGYSSYAQSQYNSYPSVPAVADPKLSNNLSDYLAPEQYELEVNYFLSRLLDLANSSKSDREAVEEFVDDKRVVRFFKIVLAKDLDLNPLIDQTGFQSQIEELAEGRDLSEYVRSTIYDQLRASQIDIKEFRKAAAADRIYTGIHHNIHKLQFLRQGAGDFFNEIGLTASAAAKSLADSALGFNSKSDRMAAAIAEVVIAYVETFPEERQRKMQDEILKMKGASRTDIIAYALLNSGPAMLKLAQLFYQYITAPQLKNAIKQAEENVKAMPFDRVKAVVEAELAKQGLEFDQVFETFEKTPLKAGSVSQVHKAIVRYIDENGELRIGVAAVKVLRDDYLEALTEDVNRLKALDIDPKLQRFFAPIYQSMFAEGDLRNEGKAILQASVYDRPDVGVRAVSLPYQDVVKASHGLLLLEWIEGYSVGDRTKSSRKDLVARHENLEKLFQVWTETALTGNGYFHGDLNGGNLRIETRGLQSGVFIDFGNTGKLSSDQRSAILGLISNAVEEDYQKAVRSLITLFPGLEKVKPHLLERDVQQALKAGESGKFVDVIYSLFNISAKRKAPVTPELSKFFRALTLVKQQFDFLDAQIAEFNSKQALKISTARSFDQVLATVIVKALKTGISGQSSAPAAPPKKSPARTKGRKSYGTLQCYRAQSR
jgi:predicted unusual protein kinase regulating ubiquinone biosynthesis (AarF/ABC1/UbiB family)